MRSAVKRWALATAPAAPSSPRRLRALPLPSPTLATKAPEIARAASESGCVRGGMPGSLSTKNSFAARTESSPRRARWRRSLPSRCRTATAGPVRLRIPL